MSPSQTYDFAFACCSIASVALLIWEHVITFGREVQMFWGVGLKSDKKSPQNLPGPTVLLESDKKSPRKLPGPTVLLESDKKSPRKLSGPTVLYSLLRYGTLVEKISVLLLASWYMTPHGCDVAVRFQIFPMILRSLGFGAFSALRVFALQRMKWRLAAFVFLLCMPSLIMPAYVYAHQTAKGVNQFGCQLAYTASQDLHTKLRIAGLVADLLGEIIVIVVTVNRTFRVRNEMIMSQDGNVRPPLMKLFLQDGSVYFVALLILSLADMLVLVFDHVPSFATRYDYWVVPYYTPVFRTIIICRFLLMLRKIRYDENASEEGEEGEPPLGTLKIGNRVIGIMGASVSTQFDDDPDSWEDESDNVVYSRDPLATGMMQMETFSSSSGGASGSGKGKEVLSSSDEDIRMSNEA